MARIVAIDAGGTMTDTFVVDAAGRFTVGKAQTTPEDESVGFVHSVADALRYWSLTPGQAFPGLVSSVYSGTAMLNRLLQQKGRRVGLIVTAGMEDYLRLERGAQTYLGYSYADRLHVVTHRHNTPLVPRTRIRGVRERVDRRGHAIIPLYEDEARDAVAALLRAGAEGLCVNLLFSYLNPVHEQRIAAIAREVMSGPGGRAVPIFLSSELYPVHGDLPRLNTLLVEAYAADPSREQLVKVRGAARALGAGVDLRVMASHGGTISIEAREMARTLISGPIGGVVGARHLGGQLGIDHLVCTDIGGTSFDTAMVVARQIPIRSRPDIAHFLLNLPMVHVDSLGAGTGSYLRVNPISGRVEIGPDSAGSRIGMGYPAGAVEHPTVTDCHLVLGYLDPDNFLGGEVKLDRERAVTAIRERIAVPLALDVDGAAAGVVDLFEDHLRQQVRAMVLGRGYAPEACTLLCYGGGGPLHVAGYTAGMAFQDVLVPSWAAGFSAFGCACAEFEYRFDASVDLDLGAAPEGRASIVTAMAASWDRLAATVAAEFAKSGIAADRVRLTRAARMKYRGQLNDLEVALPPEARPDDAAAVEALVAAFEDVYATVYARAARSPELGFTITTAVVTGRVDVEKPLLPDEPDAGPAPAAGALRHRRAAWFGGRWHDTPAWAMEALRAGNRVDGPAVIESSSTTMVVPPGRHVVLDRHRIFHMREDG